MMGNQWNQWEMQTKAVKLTQESELFTKAEGWGDGLMSSVWQNSVVVVDINLVSWVGKNHHSWSTPCRLMSLRTPWISFCWKRQRCWKLFYTCIFLAITSKPFVCASHLLGVSVMSSGHRFSKEGKVIGFSQRVKKGKEKVCMGMLYTENWKLPHCFPSLLPASSQTKSLPTLFSDKIFAYYFSRWSKLFQCCFVIGFQLHSFSCYAFIWGCNEISPGLLLLDVPVQ